MRVDDNRAAPGRTVLGDARMKLPLGNVLQVLVDRELDARSRCRRPFEAAERVAPRIGVDEDRARLAAYLRVVGILETTQADVVDAGPAQKLRCQLLVRIEAAALFDEADGVEVQRGHTLRLVGRHLPAHVRECA